MRARTREERWSIFSKPPGCFLKGGFQNGQYAAGQGLPRAGRLTGRIVIIRPVQTNVDRWGVRHRKHFVFLNHIITFYLPVWYRRIQQGFPCFLCCNGQRTWFFAKFPNSKSKRIGKAPAKALALFLCKICAYHPQNRTETKGKQCENTKIHFNALLW